MTEKKKDNCELQSAKEEVAKQSGHGTWENLLEQDSYDHSNMMGHWEEVARLLSYRVEDFRMAFEPWGKVIDHVQHNQPPGIRLGSHISEYVLKLLQDLDAAGVTTEQIQSFKAYNQGYRDASKKAIEIITKGL